MMRFYLPNQKVDLKMHVKVKKEDYVKGICGDAWGCALARAINRVLPQSGFSCVGRNSIAITVPDAMTQQVFELNTNLKSFILDFDWLNSEINENFNLIEFDLNIENSQIENYIIYDKISLEEIKRLQHESSNII